MEICAALIVVVPLLVPLGVAFGLDPIQLDIIFPANMEVGFLCPPVGLSLLAEVTRATFPMLLVLLITYFPHLTTFLPRLFK